MMSGPPFQSRVLSCAGPAAPAQDVRFAHTSDGVRIAYATFGTGPPLVKTPSWCGHLDFDWRSPVWRHWTNFGPTIATYAQLDGDPVRTAALDRDFLAYARRQNRGNPAGPAVYEYDYVLMTARKA
jgi:hypothetical protein